MSFDVKQLKRFEKGRLKNAKAVKDYELFLWHSLSPQDSNYIASVYFDRSHIW